MQIETATKDQTVPVTGVFLALVVALNAAKTLFINEAIMAEEMFGENTLDPYDARCADLFCSTYAKEAVAAGLSPTPELSDVILGISLSEEVMNTPFAELPGKFVFHPRRGIEAANLQRLAA